MPLLRSPSLSTLAKTIAGDIVRAHRTGQPWRPAAFDEGLSIGEGYAIQAEVAHELGWFASGAAGAWKVGGVVPNASGSPLPVVLPSGAAWSTAGVQGAAMEAEVAVRLGRTPADAQDVVNCIDRICVAIEMVGTRLDGGMTAPAPWKLADQQVHGVLVAGAEKAFSPAALPAWSSQAFEVEINGVQAATGRGTPLPSGDPLSTLPWLFDHARRAGLALSAGDLITTGAWAVIGVKAGDRVEVRFDGIGEALVTCG